METKIKKLADISNRSIKGIKTYIITTKLCNSGAYKFYEVLKTFLKYKLFIINDLNFYTLT